MSDYQVFNMKDVLQTICERKKEEIEDIELGKEENFKEDDLKLQKKILAYISIIPTNITIEDLPFYRDYLSKFTLSHLFRDKPLLTKSDDVMLSKADGDLLLKLVCGSFSSSYQIAYNEEKGGLELTIQVEADEEVHTGKLEELWLFQLENLFVIYLNEQLTVEYYLQNNTDKNFIKENMDIRLILFEQKMRALEENYRQRKNDNEDIDAELDELLRS